MQRRQFLAGVAGAAGMAGAPSAFGQVATPNAEFNGDLALINANIITLDTARPRAQAALVRNGRIALVGSTAEVRQAAGRAEVFDAGGKTVIPGFVDNHCHVEWSCMSGDWMPSLRGAASIEEMLVRIRAEMARTPAGQWVVVNAGGFPDAVAEKRWMTREDLDKVSTDRPIMVLLGIHASIMNTKAFEVSGYMNAGDTSARWTDGAQRRGSFVHRDAQGRPTGVVSEVWDLIGSRYTTDQYVSSIRNRFKEWFTAKGLTSITTLPNVAPEQFKALQITSASGDLTARIRHSPTIPHAIPLNALTQVGWMSGAGDSLLRFGGVKIFVDNGGDGMGGRDVGLKWVQQGLEQTMRQCTANGLQAILHVVTPQGMTMALDAIAAARAAHPDMNHLMHRIDHLTPTSIEQIRQLKALNVGLGITAPSGPLPASASARGGYGREHRYRTLLNEGVKTCLVLDAAGPGGNYSPWRGVANVITDLAAGGMVRDGEAVTLDQALKMWTVWAAEMNGDNDRGVIADGKLGDFAVASADPTGKPGAEVRAITNTATILGGKVVYRA
jgi:predicted amidohydrolase YtcJ